MYISQPPTRILSTKSSRPIPSPQLSTLAAETNLHEFITLRKGVKFVGQMPQQNHVVAAAALGAGEGEVDARVEGALEPVYLNTRMSQGLI